MNDYVDAFLSAAHAYEYILVNAAFAQVHSLVPIQVRMHLQLADRPACLPGMDVYAFQCMAPGYEDLALAPTRDWTGVRIWQFYNDTQFGDQYYSPRGVYRNLDSLLTAMKELKIPPTPRP